MTKSSWASRLLVAIPFAIAGLLNAVMLGVEYLHLRLDYIATYAFVFAGPWARLENVADITNRLNVQNRWIEGLITYVALLWIPAVLYAACMLLLLVILGILERRLLNHVDSDVVKTLKRRTTITSAIVVVAALFWFVAKLCRNQVACNRRNTAFALRVESIKRDAFQQLKIGTKKDDVARFYAKHEIPFEVTHFRDVGSEVIGALDTIGGCAPLGCGTNNALIGVRVRIDADGAVIAQPEVVDIYTDCL